MPPFFVSLDSYQTRVEIAKPEETGFRTIYGGKESQAITIGEEDELGETARGGKG